MFLPGCIDNLFSGDDAAVKLGKCSSFVLRKRDSVWIPMGHVPIVIGLEDILQVETGTASMWNKYSGPYLHSGLLEVPSIYKLDCTCTSWSSRMPGK